MLCGPRAAGHACNLAPPPHSAPNLPPRPTPAHLQVDKVIQLYEVMLTRHTTMVVGQTGGGKSVIINALARAQTRAGKRTTLHVLNPKAIPVAELYGAPCLRPAGCHSRSRGPLAARSDGSSRCAADWCWMGAPLHACRRAGPGHPRLDGRAAELHLPRDQPPAAARQGRGALPGGPPARPPHPPAPLLPAAPAAQPRLLHPAVSQRAARPSADVLRALHRPPAFLAGV
jgi:hypothetical protein